jgi:ABC-2 type transport system permease protein
VGSQLRLYPVLIWARIRSQLQYRLSFAFMVAGSFALTLVDFLTILVLFQHMPALGGWSLEEVAFLYGSAYVSFKATDAAIGHLETLPAMVRMGTLDTLLIRPLGSLYQVITADFALRHIGAVSQGVIILAYAISQLSIEWDAGRLAVFISMLISSGLIFGSIWVIGTTIVFWTAGNGLEYLNSITYGGNQAVSYPLNIYAGWLRRLVMFVIPLGFVNYFPSLYILDRPDPLGSPEILRFLSPVVAVVMVLLARWVWGMGIRHYRSTGS